MLRYCYLLLFLPFLLFSSVDIQKIIDRCIENQNTVGIVVGLLDQGKMEFYSSGKMGKNNQTPVDENTLFEIGSISKVITAIIYEDMILRGEIQRDDPIENYLSFLGRSFEYKGKKILLDHLLTHTAGFPYMPPGFVGSDPADLFKNCSEEQLIYYLKNVKFSREPGKIYEYSNIGISILGYILSKKAGMTFEELMQKRVCRYLKMDSTVVEIPDALKHKFAKGHVHGEEVDNWNTLLFAAAGGVRSTAKDLLHFLAGQMKVLPSSLDRAFEKATEGFIKTENDNIYIAHNWHIYTSHSPYIFAHSGITGGYHAFLAFRPDLNKGVIVLSNSITDIQDIGMHILDQRYELKQDHEGIILTPMVLDRYVGSYRHASGIVGKIFRENYTLKAKILGYPLIDFIPKTVNKFFVKAVSSEATFIIDENDQVNGLKVQQVNQQYYFKKIR